MVYQSGDASLMPNIAYDWLNSNGLDLLKKTIQGKTADELMFTDKVRGKTLIQIIADNDAEEMIAADLGTMLLPQLSFADLKKRLVGAVSNYRSGQSYGTVALNEVADRFFAVIGYIDLLQSYAKSNGDESGIKEQAKELKTVAVEAFERKTGVGRLFIAEENKELWGMLEVASRKIQREAYQREKHL